MTPWWLTLLQEQQRNAFADLAGTRADVVLPVADTLLTHLALQRLPSRWPVRDLTLRALGENAIAVRVRLSRPSFLPAISIRLVIERQPQLPDTPVLVLRVIKEGVAALAAPLLQFVDALPPFLRFDGERLFVDLRVLAQQYGAEQWLQFLQTLQLTTEPGWVIVTAQGALPPPGVAR
jgi:hypothetical protein